MNSLEGKVILVTGASGFIGSHLAARLSGIPGVRLLLLARHASQTTHQGMTWLQAELCQLIPDYWHAHEIRNIDYVFHLAAFIPKTSAQADRINPVVEDNILATRALLESLPGGITKVVFSSTIDVYAQLETGELLTEDSPVRPGTLYGSSKLFCEHLISVWAKEKGCDYAILRYGHIYGPGEERYEKFIPVVIRNLLANRPPLIYGDGSALRDYLYVGDAVEATLRAARAEGNIGPLNVARGESVTLKEVAQLLMRLVGSNKEINFLPNKPNGNSLRFDSSLMAQALGSWSMTSLDEGLASEVEAFRRNEGEQK